MSESENAGGGAAPRGVESQFRSPISPAQSPLLDPAIARETQAFENNEDQGQKRKEARDLHGMRMSHSWLLLCLALVWVFVILIVVLLQGFGQWFTPLFKDYEHIPFELSDTIIVAFITSTTATVLGLYGISAYWLYGQPKQAESVEKEKPS